ncbi:MAG: cytochrome c [Gammaproteobacteria bacterium]|jgi:cytochrome c556
MTSRQIVAVFLAVAGLCACDAALAQLDGPGWTGRTDPEAVIAARQALMTEMERLIMPIDLFTVGESADPDDLRSAALSIAQMIRAFPHLFPPTTDLYDAQADTPATLALPAVWDDFPAFYSLSAAATAAAQALSMATSESELTAGAKGLRAACDACHASFLLPYTPSTITSEDLEFDFDSLFEEIEDQ